jgi:hypothetical protein
VARLAKRQLEIGIANVDSEHIHFRFSPVALQ